MSDERWGKVERPGKWIVSACVFLLLLMRHQQQPPLTTSFQSLYKEGQLERAYAALCVSLWMHVCVCVACSYN